MRSINRWFGTVFGRRHRCPICGCRNYTETPYLGTVRAGVIGFDRKFSCGFETHWRGYRVALCAAERVGSSDAGEVDLTISLDRMRDAERQAQSPGMTSQSAH